MPTPDAAILFAAGFGTRMAPLTHTMPKPMVNVAGRPLFDHALSLMRDAGITRIAANTHYLADMMSDHLAANGVIESREPNLLDTGGGLRQAAGLLGAATVLTLNTDAVWTGPNPVPALRDAWDPDRMDALLTLVPRAAALGHTGSGDFVIDGDGRLKPGPGDIYAGLQIIKTAPFLAETEPVFPMLRIWRRMLQRGRVFGLVHGGGWCDVGQPDSIPLAEAMLERCDD